LCLASLATSCTKKTIKAEEPLPVTIREVKATTIAAGNVYSGSISADTQVDVAFKVNGYVKTLLQVKAGSDQIRSVQAGDRVSAGVILATIKDDTYRQQLLKTTAEVADARAAETKAKADFGRYSELFKEHVISRAQFDTYKQRAESSQALVAAAQASRQQAQVELNDCQLRAPISSVVLDRKVEVGTLVAINTVGFQLGDTAAVKVVFGVPASVVASIAQGAPIWMTTDAFPQQTFNGSITKIGSAADPTSRLFDLEATIPNQEGRLRVGMIATLRLGSSIGSGTAPVVPMRSIVRPPDDPKAYAVYVLEQNDKGAIARLRPITIGPMVGDDVSVASGIQEGAKVIVQGSDIVYDGERVSVVP